MSAPDSLLAARRGDLQAFNRLASEHQDLAFTLAYYLLGDEQRAAAALQTAYVQAYRAVGGFRRGTFRGWLLGWVLAACQGQPARSLPIQGDFYRKLVSLPAEGRALVILVDLLGMDYEEVAQAAGCSTRALSHRLARARHALRGTAALPDKSDRRR